MTAQILTSGIVANKKLDGNANGTAASVRAVLTAQLVDDAWKLIEEGQKAKRA